MILIATIISLTVVAVVIIGQEIIIGVIVAVVSSALLAICYALSLERGDRYLNEARGHNNIIIMVLRYDVL